MVLSQEVCTECNHLLGKKLDELLSRDSFEAVIRAEKLLPRRNKKDRFKGRRVVAHIPDEAKYGQYRGAQMRIDWHSRKLRPLDQVIVRDESGKLHSYTGEELPSADPQLFRDRPPGAVQIIATVSGALKLKAMAEEMGVRFSKGLSDIEVPPAASEATVFLETQGLIDEPIWRGIAKIAFNYLAKIQGAKYVLDEKFDRIRDYITGESRKARLVRFSRQPILADETPRLKRHGMHFVLFETQGRTLRGRVSLFNSFTYDVLLCPDLGLIYSIKSGHGFDPVSKSVHKLTGISRRFRM